MSEKTEKKKRERKAKSAAAKSSKTSSKEVETLIEELARSGNSPEKIGMILKETHGVLNVKDETGKSVSQILKEKLLAEKIPSDLKNLMARSNSIRTHLLKNKKDLNAKYGLQLTESNIRKLAKYYKRKKVLPAGWTYESEKEVI